MYWTLARKGGQQLVVLVCMVLNGNTVYIVEYTLRANIKIIAEGEEAGHSYRKSGAGDNRTNGQR
jgi:hypothetical protein